MLIREARVDEITEILELLRDMDGEEPLAYEEAMDIWHKIKEYPYYKVFVAEEDRKLIGVCSLIIIENLGHSGLRIAIAENVIVSPEHRGEGVGAALMRHSKNQANQENCYKLMLSSNEKRIDAHRFYKKLGFKQHGISFLIEP